MPIKPFSYTTYDFILINTIVTSIKHIPCYIKDNDIIYVYQYKSTIILHLYALMPLAPHLHMSQGSCVHHCFRRQREALTSKIEGWGLM